MLFKVQIIALLTLLLSLPAQGGMKRCTVFSKENPVSSVLNRPIEINTIISLKKYSSAEKRNFFRELSGAGAYVEFPTDQDFEGGLIDPKSLTSRSTFRLLGHTNTRYSIVDEIIVRAFLPQGNPEALVLFETDLSLELKLSRLTKKNIDTLRQHSAGVITVNELFAEASNRAFAKEAVTLGIGDPMYSIISEVLGCRQYDQYYEDYSIRQITDSPRAPDHVHYFLNLISRRNKIFLIPRNLLTYESELSDFGDKNITKREFRWLMRDPENRMKNVLFVFGAYHALPYEAFMHAEESDITNILNNVDLK